MDGKNRLNELKVLLTRLSNAGWFEPASREGKPIPFHEAPKSITWQETWDNIVPAHVAHIMISHGVHRSRGHPGAFVTDGLLCHALLKAYEHPGNPSEALPHQISADDVNAFREKFFECMCGLLNRNFPPWVDPSDVAERETSQNMLQTWAAIYDCLRGMFPGSPAIKKKAEEFYEEYRNFRAKTKEQTGAYPEERCRKATLGNLGLALAATPPDYGPNARYLDSLIRELMQNVKTPELRENYDDAKKRLRRTSLQQNQTV